MAGGLTSVAAPAIPTAARSKASRLGWLAAAVLACVAVAIAWIHWTEKPPPAPLVRFTVDPPPGEKFFAYSWPSVSPDGERILFGVAAPPPGGPPRMWMYRLSTGESAPFQNLTYSWAVRSPWSPDGNSVVAYQNNILSRVDMTGTRSEVLRENLSEFAWGPSGSYLFGIAEKGLFWVERGSSRRQVTVQKPGEGIHLIPQLLPDGKRFLFEKRQTTAVETWLASLDGKDPKLLLTKASQAWYAPPGYLLYLESGSLLAQRFDASRGVLIGDARTVVSGVAANPNDPFGMFSVSRNGVLAFRQGSVTNPNRLTWFDRGGNVIGTLGDVADYSNPALSPDGQRLAVCIRDSNGKRNIWVFDLARGTRNRVTFETADDSNPVWSPDGSEIAYSSDRRGHRDMYAKPSSGTGQERVLLESSDDKTMLDWSSDGKSLFYSVRKPQPTRELWILPLTGSQRVPAPFSGAPYQQDQAIVAPDSRSVITPPWRLATGATYTSNPYRPAGQDGRSPLPAAPIPNGEETGASSFIFRQRDHGGGCVRAGLTRSAASVVRSPVTIVGAQSICGHQGWPALPGDHARGSPRSSHHAVRRDSELAAVAGRQVGYPQLTLTPLPPPSPGRCSDSRGTNCRDRISL